MMRSTGLVILMAFVVLVPALASTGGNRSALNAPPTQISGRYEMPETFARSPKGIAKAVALFEEDVLLGTAWMEPSDATEPDARLVFDDQEDVSLLAAFLGADTGGDIMVKIKLLGETVVGNTKDVIYEYVEDDDVVITRWWTFGVLPRGRYRVKIAVRDGTLWGKGKSMLHFEVLDLD
jgi:hypothetical protein